ncbi:MAG: hypothetical protein ACT4P3_13680 [Betaproteobacteria bacterium]
MRLAIAVLAAAVLAACGDQPPQPRVGFQPAASGGTSATTPPTNEERKEGSNPVQGQVDPKESRQHNDFKQRGDQRGPTSPDTQPKN